MRLINADEIQYAKDWVVTDRIPTVGGFNAKAVYTATKEQIDAMPTVDAVPVRYGHWIYHPDWQEDGECGYECSECLRGVDVDYAYCPNCGAKMNEEDNEQKKQF